MLDHHRDRRTACRPGGARSLRLNRVHPGAGCCGRGAMTGDPGAGRTSGDVPVERDATPTSSPLLQACEISKSFGAVQANQSIDFDVTQGEIHALLGENGAGKTTL